MNVPLLVAGALSLLAAAIHGGVGEAVVVRRLSTDRLRPTRFGGPSMTKAMIRASWHIATVTFAILGVALLLSGSIIEGDLARGIGLLAAWTSTGIGAVVLGVASVQVARSLRSSNLREHGPFRHPGPVVLAAIPILAWWGIS